MADNWDLRFISLANLVASWSKDPSTKCGAVIVDSNRRIISTGYNGFARGVVDSPERLNNRAIKYSMVLHAETNAILFGRDVRECAIYVYPFAPCAHCASQIVQAGISIVHYPIGLVSEADLARWKESHTLARLILSEGGVKIQEHQIM